MNIQIGNDVTVRFSLPTNITHDCELVRCYFVSTSSIDGVYQSNNVSNHRFPREPHTQYYTPNKYELNCCGAHVYNVYPVNTYSNFECSYAGFGVYSKQFAHRRHHFITPSLNRLYLHNYVYYARYIADGNYILTKFPACEQFFDGLYKLIVETVVDGKVSTIDFGVLFTLVVSGGVTDGYIDISSSMPDTSKSGYIGFSDISNPATLNIRSLDYVQDLFGAHTVINDVRGNYLYIISNKPIAAAAINGLIVDLNSAIIINEKYYYRSVDTFIQSNVVVIVYESKEDIPAPVLDKLVLMEEELTFSTSATQSFILTLDSIKEGNISIILGDSKFSSEFYYDPDEQSFYVSDNNVKLNIRHSQYSPSGYNIYGQVGTNISDNFTVGNTYQFKVASVWK